MNRNGIHMNWFCCTTRLLLSKVFLIMKHSLYLKPKVENLQFTGGGCITAMSHRICLSSTLAFSTQVTPSNKMALNSHGIVTWWPWILGLCFISNTLSFTCRMKTTFLNPCVSELKDLFPDEIIRCLFGSDGRNTRSSAQECLNSAKYHVSSCSFAPYIPIPQTPPGKIEAIAKMTKRSKWAKRAKIRGKEWQMQGKARRSMGTDKVSRNWRGKGRGKGKPKPKANVRGKIKGKGNAAVVVKYAAHTKVLLCTQFVELHCVLLLCRPVHEMAI